MLSPFFFLVLHALSFSYLVLAETWPKLHWFLGAPTVVGLSSPRLDNDFFFFLLMISPFSSSLCSRLLLSCSQCFLILLSGSPRNSTSCLLHSMTFFISFLLLLPYALFFSSLVLYALSFLVLNALFFSSLVLAKTRHESHQFPDTSIVVTHVVSSSLGWSPKKPHRWQVVRWIITLQ